MKPSLICSGLSWLAKVTVQPEAVVLLLGLSCPLGEHSTGDSSGRTHLHCSVTEVQLEWQQTGRNVICCSTGIAAIPWVGSVKAGKISCWTLMGLQRLFFLFFQAWPFGDRYISPPGLFLCQTTSMMMAPDHPPAAAIPFCVLRRSIS